VDFTPDAVYALLEAWISSNITPTSYANLMDLDAVSESFVEDICEPVQCIKYAASPLFYHQQSDDSQDKQILRTCEMF
jgi:hypothetical protein